MPGQFAAQCCASDQVEFMLPHRTVINLLVQSTHMGQFVNEGFEAVVASIASNQDSLAASERDPAHLSSMDILDYRFAHQVHFPARRHRFPPDSRPGLPRDIGDVF